MSKLLSVYETSKRFSVSTATVRKWIADGELSCIRVGKVIRVSEDQLAEFIAENERKRAVVVTA